MSDWRLIDSVPANGTEVLLFQPLQTHMKDLGLYASDPSGQIFTGSCDEGNWSYTIAGDRWNRNDYFGDFISPTHWMPLPEPPSDQ